MKFKVTVDFRKGPSYGTEIEAENKHAASNFAVFDARKYGFDAAVKKVTVSDAEAIIEAVQS